MIKKGFHIFWLGIQIMEGIVDISRELFMKYLKKRVWFEAK